MAKLMRMLGSQVSYGRGCSCCNAQRYNAALTRLIRRSIRATENRAWKKDQDA